MNINAVLACPACKEELSIEDKIFFCKKCGKRFVAKEDIYDFLINGEDAWKYFQGGLFGNDKELEDKFLKTSDSELAPSDLLLKGLIYWYKGNFEAYEKIMNNPEGKNYYTEDYQKAMQSSLDYTKNLLKREKGIIMDLATGMGGLLIPLVKENDMELLSVDISPTSSYGLSRYLKFLKKDHLLTQIVADAKLLPFKSGSIDVITTAAGFQNMEDGEKVFKELRRVSKKLIGICLFMEENDPNLKPEKDKTLYVKKYFKDGLEKAGWKVHFENEIMAKVEPTPRSEILGIRPDEIPETPTVEEFAVVVAE